MTAMTHSQAAFEPTTPAQRTITAGRATMSTTTAQAGETMQASTRSVARLRKPEFTERLEFRLLVAVSFAVCLLGFAVRRLTGRAPKGSSYWSCVTEARSAAYAAAGYAFHA
jgi:hypothetical protein